jgi:hypothetical protein
MKYIKVRIVIGASDGVFDIYYDSVDSNKRALLHSNGQPAIGLTFDELSGPNGVIVSVPDESSSIVVTSDPDSFCSNDINVNNDSYTTPIGCYTYTITSSNGIFNYYYTDCECNEISATIDGTNGQVQDSFCALYGTVNAGELELTFVQGCETTSIELCYDQNSPVLACECELVPEPTPTPVVTPTPTEIISEGICFSYTYTQSDFENNLLPNVRYRSIDDTIITTTINGLTTRDNYDQTYTAFICVKQGGSYATPVCVNGSIEITCPNEWITGSSCSSQVPTCAT